MMEKLAALALTLTAFPHAAAASSASPAEGAAQPPAASTELRYDLPLDLGVTLGGAALSLTLELLNPELAPRSCRWCDRDANGRNTLNGLDASMRSLRWSNLQAADTASTVFSYALAPAAGIGVGALIAWHDDRLEELPLDLLIVAEAAIIAENLNQITKLIVARERPDVHACTAAERERKRDDGDNLSFFSGHTTLAFALAASAGTVATLRRHRLAPVMWVAGMMLATASGYLRIAADRHYATDVFTGAMVGSAIGVGLPYFAHRPAASGRVAVVPTGDGAFLLWKQAW